MHKIILIHEIYGITDNIRSLKTLLGQQGYHVECPQLYSDGYVGTDEREAYERFYTNVGTEKAKEMILDMLEVAGSEQATLIGFSVGATIAWLLAEDSRVRRIICVYGSRIRNHMEIEPKAKAELFFVREESFNVQEVIDQISTKQGVSTQLIPGKHGFYTKRPFNDQAIQSLNTKILRILADNTDT